MRALRVELLRLRSRRAVRLLILLGLLGCLLVVGFAIKDAVPPGAAELAAAQQQVDSQLADQAFTQMLDDCRAAVGNGGNEQFPADMDCAQMMPQLRWFLNWQAPDFVRDYRAQLLIVTLVLTLVMTVAGITIAGAEWSSGSIGTQLLFQSRRSVVYGSKVGALVLVAVIVGLIGVILTWAATYWTASRWGTTALLQEDPLTGRPMPISAAVLVQRALRAVAGVAAGGVGGFALAMVFRSSLAALGVAAGYALVGEAVLRGVWRNIEPQLLSSRVAAFLDGQFVITRFPQSCGSGTCEPEIIRISALQGGVTLAVLLAAVLLVSVVSFQRRDVG